MWNITIIELYWLAYYWLFTRHWILSKILRTFGTFTLNLYLSICTNLLKYLYFEYKICLKKWLIFVVICKWVLLLNILFLIYQLLDFDQIYIWNRFSLFLFLSSFIWIVHLLLLILMYFIYFEIVSNEKSCASVDYFPFIWFANRFIYIMNKIMENNSMSD